MPSVAQVGESRSECKSEAARHVKNWPNEWLLNLHPMNKSTCREYIGACNAYDAPLEVTKHFVSIARTEY